MSKLVGFRYQLKYCEATAHIEERRRCAFLLCNLGGKKRLSISKLLSKLLNPTWD